VVRHRRTLALGNVGDRGTLSELADKCVHTGSGASVESTRLRGHLYGLAAGSASTIRAFGAQLLARERRTSRAGKDSISHPPRGHDDPINNLAGGLRARTTHDPANLGLTL
jgi:hypothetical protein